MNHLLNHSKAKIFCYSIDICFLCIHIFMVYLFAVNKVTPMVKFNIFSIIFYVFTLFMIHKEFLRYFVIGTYIEVLLHMTLAVIYTGWGNGFQITLIGMNILAFFAEYVGRSISRKYVPATPLCILGMLAYINSFIINNKFGTIYPLPEKTSTTLEITWGIIVFIIGIVCLQGFTLLSFHSARLLSNAAIYDKLTSLPNRYYVSKNEKDYLSTNRWIAIADIDDFKKINDTYGHNFGDYVLKTLASMMKSSIKDTEACRWGGEEFLIIGKGKDINKAYKLLDKFRNEVSTHEFKENETSTKLTITIGLTQYKDGMSLDEWVNTADKKLYAGKYSGKNKVVL